MSARGVEKSGHMIPHGDYDVVEEIKEMNLNESARTTSWCIIIC